MKYYAFKRRKSPNTITFGVITINDPLKLPDSMPDPIGNGEWIKCNPWEREDEFYEGNAPYWFSKSDADSCIAKFGYWLVDFQESSLECES